MSERKVIINCSELGAGTRGASTFFRYLEKEANVRENTKFTTIDKVQIQIQDYNPQLATVSCKNALRIELIAKTANNTIQSAITPLQNQKFTLFLSGDHSNAIGTISAIKTAFPMEKLGVIWIDAHYDLHSPYTSPSGNVHGMPVAALLNEDNLSHKKNEISGDCKRYWEEIKNLGVEGKKITAENLVFIAARDFEKEEGYIVQEKGIKSISVEKLRASGARNVAMLTLQYLKNCDIIYVSFDVDSMDPDEVSYGTGTPVKNGLKVDEVQDLFSVFLEDKRVIATEIVEINPTLDDDNLTMVKTSFDIINQILNLKY